MADLQADPMTVRQVVFRILEVTKDYYQSGEDFNVREIVTDLVQAQVDQAKG